MATTDDMRASLLRELCELSGVSDVDSATWSFLVVADLENLRSAVQRARERDPLVMYMLFGGQVHQEIIKSWLTRIRRRRDNSQDEASIVPQKRNIEDTGDQGILEGTKTRKSLPHKRSPAATASCYTRDHNACVITKFNIVVEGCHIYPHSLGNKKGEDTQALFWGLLKVFWSEEKVKLWEKEVLGPTGVESCHNLITLCPNAHSAWGRCLFALEPLQVAEDNRSIRVRFEWLPKKQFAKKIPLTQCPPSPAEFESSHGNFRFHNEITGDAIKTGDVIEITTDDPENCPLPSFQLLTMQWTLHRVAALSGAADICDDYDDDDSEFEDATEELTIYGEETAERPARRGPNVSSTGENQPPARASSKAREHGPATSDDTAFKFVHRPPIR